MKKAPEAFRTISEVSDILDTPAHVLRFWESKFYQIRPVKRAGGRRYYRPDDLALLAGIRLLLQDQGMTIRGVQKVLQEQGIRHVASLAPDPSVEGSLDGSLASDADDARDDDRDTAGDDGAHGAANDDIADAQHDGHAPPHPAPPAFDSAPPPRPVPERPRAPMPLPPSDELGADMPNPPPPDTVHGADAVIGADDEPETGNRAAPLAGDTDAVPHAPRSAEDAGSVPESAAESPTDAPPAPEMPPPAAEPPQATVVSKRNPVAPAPDLSDLALNIGNATDPERPARVLRAMPRHALDAHHDKAALLARRIDALLDRMSDASGAGRW